MLINLRNALMTGKKIPYIETFAAAGQWADTGIKSAGSYLRIIIQFAMTRFKTSESTEGYQYIFSGDYSGGQRWTSAEVIVGDTPATQARLGKRVAANIGSDTTRTWSTTRLNLEDIYLLDFEAKTSPSKTLTMKGTFTASYTYQGYGPSTGNINLFRAMHATSLNCVPYTRIFGIQMFTSPNVLAADFVPMGNGTTGFLHDNVRGVDLYSQGGTPWGFGVIK